MDTIKSFSANAIDHVIKHIKIYFEGVLDIDGLGRFYFEQGRLLKPNEGTKAQLAFVTLVNQTIKERVPVAQW